MITTYELRYHNDRGDELAILDQTLGFSFARVMNGVGWLVVTLPGDFDDTILTVDGILEIWRKAGPTTAQWQISGFLRKFTYYTTQEGIDAIEISGPDINDLVERRIVAYASGSAQADQTDEADDMLKVIARQNLGASATSVRDLSSLGFTVQPDLVQGPSISKGIAWRDVFRVYQDLVEASAGSGTNLYWEIVPVTPKSFEFRTYINQPGVDHTLTSGRDPVVFGLGWGNLSEPRLELDYSQEITHVYVGGQGEGAERQVEEISDYSRIGRSRWNRREAFVDARNESTITAIVDRGIARLNEGKPRLRFTGNLIDSDQFPYGVSWAFGDRVTVEYRGQQFDGLVSAVLVQVDSRGNETIQTRFEVDDVLR